jgi:hypothetical protein
MPSDRSARAAMLNVMLSNESEFMSEVQFG